MCYLNDVRGILAKTLEFVEVIIPPHLFFIGHGYYSIPVWSSGEEVLRTLPHIPDSGGRGAERSHFIGAHKQSLVQLPKVTRR